jgi:hypothetical protein
MGPACIMGLLLIGGQGHIFKVTDAHAWHRYNRVGRYSPHNPQPLPNVPPTSHVVSLGCSDILILHFFP